MPLSAPVSGRAQSSCDCFKASSSSEAYFAHHKFFDFRNKGSGSSSVSGSALAVPQPITDRDQDTAAPVTNAYFSSDEWTDTWDIQNWSTGDGPVFRANSKNNMYFAQDSGSASSYLTMRTTRQNDYQSTSEFQTTSADYQFLSIRMYARTRGSPGAVTAMFTYLGSSPVQEADIEIRTERPTHEAQYTNQPSYSDEDDSENPNATSIVNMATPWTDWQEHRYDWTPGLSEWYVNGEKVASITFQAPVDPTTLIFNVWGDGGVWSGKMAPGGAAQMDIQWIDLAYNNTEQAAISSCSHVCIVDELLSS
ncbi:concanavalin A-like lectin/glucanase domain-containing protein [Biscogniauxia mediterranea]|nr:concanavalin A-like lectin/glucanase domain-containing protein [Biscogniauxia mediterranea]